MLEELKYYCSDDEYYSLILDFYEKPRTDAETEFWTSHFIIALMKVYKQRGGEFGEIARNSLVLILALFYSPTPEVERREVPDDGYFVEALSEFCSSLQV
ncbi:MAG: hypothetical protein ACTSU5_12550 [Promethearchaeota archaeon]